MTGRTKKLIWATLLISGFAFLSRILGLLRATLLSARYGATESQGLTDCYSAAFKLPDIIFNLVAFGAISIVLIPYFSNLLNKEDKRKLQEACSSFLTFFFLLISFSLVIGFFITPFFVRRFLVAGWTNEINILLTIKMTRILLLQVLFMTLSGIMGSYLNALHRFGVYAFALLSYNVGILFGIIFLTPYLGIEGVAWGAVIGSLIHMTLQTGGAVYNGFRYSVRLPRLNREMFSLVGIAIPRIIGIGGEQFVKFFIVSFASFIFTGSIFIFENAENFSMVAYGMIAVSISTTAFPVFSKLFTEGDFSGMVESLLKNLSVLLYLILPVVSLMVLLRFEIIEVLVGYNRYTPNDVKLTAEALAWYILGIPFFSVTIIVVKFFYAQKRSLMPMFVSLGSSAVTVATAFFLARTMDISGLSAGRSAGYIIQMILLVGILIASLHGKIAFSKEYLKSIGIIARTVIIALALFISSFFIIKLFVPVPDTKLLTLVKLFLVGSLFSIVYLIAGLIGGIPEAHFIFDKGKQIIIRFGRLIWKHRPVSHMILIFLFIIIIVTPAALINISVVHISKSSIFKQIENIDTAPKQYQAAVVLGAKVYPSGNLSPILEDRITTGLELYRAGLVKKILVSGDHGAPEYNESNAMRDFLLKKGVPGEDIFTDHAGFTTHDSLYRARVVFLIDTCIIVTQDYHAYRSLYIARKLGLDAIAMTADKRTYRYIDRYQAREILSRIKAWLYINLEIKPKFLGPVIPIEGDGRLSWD